MNYSKTIKELRNQKGLSQKKLADLLQISQSAIAKWELEKTEPTASALINLSKFFEVSTDYILGLEKEDGTKIYNNFGQDFRNSNFNNTNININKQK